MQLFPEQFNPQSWQGIRKKSFPQACDAFQQLVGDALRREFAAKAHIASTSGKDGAIDAWIDETGTTKAQFADFTFPLLIECKHHDEEAANPANNIKQGWTKVKDKLTKQAQEGWPKLYAPWQRARAYLYCISARFPNQQARDALQKEIRDFFAGLPAEQALDIPPEQIRVWDWSDLQGWFNQHTLLCDHWLGIELPEWIDHASACARIKTGRHSFKAYLLEENLAFVPPAENDPTHPRQLLLALEQNRNPLLIGEGGIGKTRTLYEVAQLAHDQGWRVLHLIPTEQEIDLRTAAKILLQPATDTLVVIDYIDQLAHFDAHYWRNILIPEAERRGVRLHLLTNARPPGASASLPHLQESGLFAETPIQSDALQRERVASAIETRLCPTAISQIGHTAVKGHCGQRPIIAMFIAQALEQLAQTGQLLDTDTELPRSDDLLGWIRKRLREARLLPAANPARSPWAAPVLPDPELIAIAAGLAACPLFPAELDEVLGASLAAQGAATHHTAQIIAALQEGGWIENSDKGLYNTPHDAIADEVLREILSVPQTTLPHLLASANQGRPLGRFARSLGRLSGVAALPERQRHGIEASARQWLSENAISLGQTLRQRAPDHTAYALGALFDYPAWQDVAQQNWDDLITPWLSQHGQLPAARHLLHRGLRAVPDNTLLQAALNWLQINGKGKNASFILAPLLAWTVERLGEHQTTVLNTALRWLGHADHATSPDAGFVLDPLLAWTVERLGEHQTTVLNTALRWLGHADHATSPDAGFVLDPLLAWTVERLGEHQTTVLDAALRWLNHAENATAPEAGYVLAPLLAWTVERLGEHQTTVLNAAFRWLGHAEHATTLEARFVFNPLLAWTVERLGEHQTTVFNAALRWLDHADHATAPEAGFVLAPLLAWTVERLGEHQTTVLNAALRWLDHADHATAPEAGFVLAPLLAWTVERLGEHQTTVLNTALRWLGHADHATSPDAGFVLPPLLKSKLVLAEQRPRIVKLSVMWLKNYPERDDATHMLKALLQAANQFPEQEHIQDVLIPAGTWLDRHPAHPERGFVIARLLRMKALPQKPWEALAQAGLDFLEKNPVSRSDDYLLNGILARLRLLPPALQQRWLALAVRWIATTHSFRDMNSLFCNCRKFLPPALLVQLQPALIEANQARQDFPDFDWTRFFAYEYQA